MIISYSKVWYSIDVANGLATTLQKNDMDWQYIIRESDTKACIEVLDCEGYHLGYL